MQRRYIKYPGLLYISHIWVNSIFSNRLTFFLCFRSTAEVLSDTLLLCSALNFSSRIALPILSATLHMGDLSIAVSPCSSLPHTGFLCLDSLRIYQFSQGVPTLLCQRHPASSHQSLLFREGCYFFMSPNSEKNGISRFCPWMQWGSLCRSLNTVEIRVWQKGPCKPTLNASKQWPFLTKKKMFRSW